MKFSSLLHPKFIKVSHRVQRQEDVIKELVKEICRDMTEEFEREVIDRITKREKESPTAMEGIAIPHARIPGFSDLIVAISIPEKPIFVNNTNVYIFFLILTGETSPLYLNVLSAIAKLRQNQTIFKKIINSKKPEEVISIVEEANLSVKKEFLIRDIMNENFPVVSPEDSLKTAIDILFERNSLYAFVVENNKLVGEITLCDIIEKKIPTYVKNIISLEFLRTFEPIEELLKDEEKVKVREVMTPVEISFAPDDSIVASALTMVRDRRNFVPVIENEKIVGVVTLEDFVKKVLRA